MIESRANNCQAFTELRAREDARGMRANDRQGCLRAHAGTFDNASNRRITSIKVYDGQTRLSLSA